MCGGSLLELDIEGFDDLRLGLEAQYVSVISAIAAGKVPTLALSLQRVVRAATRLRVTPGALLARKASRCAMSSLTAAMAAADQERSHQRESGYSIQAAGRASNSRTTIDAGAAGAV